MFFIETGYMHNNSTLSLIPTNTNSTLETLIRMDHINRFVHDKPEISFDMCVY